MLNKTTQNWMKQNGFDAQDINARGAYDDTALICASRKGEEDVVIDLLENGAAINLRNMDGTNALWSACVANNYVIADLLIELGIDIDNQNDNGATVLMYAASSGRTEWVKYLLEKGADFSLLSLDGYSAMELSDNIATLRLLKSATRSRVVEALSQQ
ncbi:MAG: ankyrin repeat domain-containing protein [Chromatiales bacterium]|jgi:ankyrin repeat protein